MEMKKIYLDTNFWIYHVSGDLPDSVTQRILEFCIDKKVSVFTSSLSVTECLVLPIREKDETTKKAFDLLFSKLENIKVVDFTKEIAKTAAQLRANHNVSTPDAIHLATAISEGVKMFITNDKRLKKVKELEIVSIKSFIDMLPKMF